jgi:surface protein
MRPTCRMFDGCASFNADLSRWNVANATDMIWMFFDCTSFNSALSRCHVANATESSRIFEGCTSFNSGHSRWHLANATDFISMFAGCISFNSDVPLRDVASAIRAMRCMFCVCDSFDCTFVAALATWPLLDERHVKASVCRLV